MLKQQTQFPFALSLSKGCTSLRAQCLQERDSASTSSARTGFVFTLALLAATVGGCAEKWPEDGRAWLEDRLSEGPIGFDCYHSNWNEEAGLPFPSPSVLQGQQCLRDPTETLWFATEDAVNAVSRCTAAGYEFEYSVTVFSADHYYDGYFCNYAAAPAGMALPPLGEMTLRGTAMDSEFRPYPKSSQTPSSSR